jgi:hypothetical protein
MSVTEPLTAGELRAVVGGIIDDVMQTDLDAVTKRIVATALKNLCRLCERERRRRALH